MLINRVYERLAQGFISEPREQGHPTIETRSHLLIAHTLVITLYDLNERSNNLSKKSDSDQHKNASNNLLIPGDRIVVSIANSGQRGQCVVADNNYLGLKSYPTVFLEPILVVA